MVEEDCLRSVRARARRGSGEAGRGSGEAGRGSGEAGRGPGEARQTQGCDRAREGRLSGGYESVSQAQLNFLDKRDCSQYRWVHTKALCHNVLCGRICGLIGKFEWEASGGGSPVNRSIVL